VGKFLGVIGAAVLVAGPALAADLPVKAPRVAPLMPVDTWTGWYLGLNAGYHWGGDCVDTVTTNIFSVGGLNGDIGGAVATQGTGGACPSEKGFIGGGQIGYNWQMNNWLVGIETDIQGASNNNDTAAIANIGTVPGATDLIGRPVSVRSVGVIASEKDLRWFGTLRGRLGFLTAPTVLLYGTGGLAYGGVEANTAIVETLGFRDSPNPFGTAGSFSGTRVGWTVGGGAEWMFMPKWSLKAEYLYYDLGSQTWSLGNINQSSNIFGLETVGASQSSTRFNGHIFRAGINLHF
jgi:outer membrane immunogenic protein